MSNIDHSGNSDQSLPESAKKGLLHLVFGQEKVRRIVRDKDNKIITAAGVTDAGVKGNNEDAFIVGEKMGVVVDGMGGGDHGKEAAQVISTAIHEDLSKPQEGLLIRAARKAARVMKSKSAVYGFDEDRDGAVVAMARDQGANIEGLIIGDPGFFIIDLTAGKVVERGKGQSTTDEFVSTLEQSNIDEALRYLLNGPFTKLDDLVLDEEQTIRMVTFLTGLRARNEAIPGAFVDRIRGTISSKVKSSMITSSISTGGVDLPPNLINFSKEPGHNYMVLLCSDGVTKYLTDHELLAICTKASDPNAAVIEINKVVQQRQGNPEYPHPDHATAVAFLA